MISHWYVYAMKERDCIIGGRALVKTCVEILILNNVYSAGEEKSPYFLFHGETALHKILKFQGETANFSEKFQGEIAEFLRGNMEFYRQNLKISGRNTGISWRKYWISWRKYWISWRNFPLFLPVSPRKKDSCSWRKIKSGDFSSLHCICWKPLKTTKYKLFKEAGHLLEHFNAGEYLVIAIFLL